MAKFLAFEDDEGKEVYINAARVRAVRSAGDKQTVVEFDDGHKVGFALLCFALPASLVVRDLEKAV
jgi:hypothetical protein